jgi:hypothetical protein
LKKVIDRNALEVYICSLALSCDESSELEKKNSNDDEPDKRDIAARDKPEDQLVAHGRYARRCSVCLLFGFDTGQKFI